jgi:uncharacterized protein involved in type VI secretion and phage assembly
LIYPDGLRDLLTQRPAEGKLWGVVVGVVTDNQDPDHLHRVKVRFPWLNDNAESNWARVVTSMAGNNRGMYFLPEVDDEVLVAFEHGSIDYPYIIGSLWNGSDAPPESNSDGANNHRSITSRSGHVVRLNDENGSETVEIVDKTKSNRIVIQTAQNKISIEAQGDIEITSSTGRITLKALGIELNSQADVKITAMSTLEASATAEVSVKGAIVNIN